MIQNIAALIFVACVARGFGWNYGDTGNYFDTGNSWSDLGGPWSQLSQPDQYGSNNGGYGGDEYGLQPSFDQRPGLGDSSGSWLPAEGGIQPSIGNSWGGDDQWPLTPIGSGSGQDQGLGGLGDWLHPGVGSWSQPNEVSPSVIGSSSGQNVGESGNNGDQSQPFTGTVSAEEHLHRLPPGCIEKLTDMAESGASMSTMIQALLSPLCFKPENWADIIGDMDLNELNNLNWDDLDDSDFY